MSDSPPTLYDVAEVAEVSPATVSRVLNGRQVNQELEARVRQAVAELHYVPNRVARGLRKRSSRLIALCIPNLSNPYFVAMVSPIERIVHEAGYSLVLFVTCARDGSEERCFRTIVSEQMAGAIVVPAVRNSPVGIMLDSNIKVVAVDRSPVEENIDRFLVDNFNGGYEGTKNLAKAGFRRIGCVSGPRGAETADQRADGWRRAMREIAPGEDLADLEKRVSFDVVSGRNAVDELVRTVVEMDAIFVANNLLSIGAIQALMTIGGTQRLGMLAFGSIPYMRVELENIQFGHLPAKQIGMAAANQLIKRISGMDSEPVHVVFPALFNSSMASEEDLAKAGDEAFRAALANEER